MARDQRIFGYEGTPYSVASDRVGNDFHVFIGEAEHRYAIDGEAGGHFDFRDAGRRVRGYAVRDGNEVWVQWNGQVFVLSLEERARRAGALTPVRDEIHAPMTGTIRRVHVAVGDTITQGQPLVVLEAMKMEHVLRAPRDGVVALVDAREGSQAEAHALLVRLAPLSEA